jgi:beta-lactamase regulating signal transducer with metallopeptidase domain/Ca2+-binding EF-hand superfamily protein
MMLQVMAYTVAVTAVLTVVGHCLERLAVLHRYSRRKAWIAAMLLSLLFPVAMILGSRTDAVPGGADAVQGTATSAPSQDSIVEAARPTPIWKLAVPTDRQLLAMWAVASLIFALYLLGANLLLSRRASGWQWRNVLGQDVLISEITGPALLGVVLPKIVVPRWLLEQPASTQWLILEHERQHMQARDPLLVGLGVLVIAAVPWNLPLWWQWRRMRQAVEMDCDARVIGTGAQSETYAHVLLEVTKRATRMPIGALAMSEPVASLERRIDCLQPGKFRLAALQTAAVLGLATAGAGAALALDAPALPVRPAATAVIQHATFIPTVTAEPARIETPIDSKESNVKKTTSMAVTVAALSAVAGAQAQSPQAPAPTPVDGQPIRLTAEQMVKNNDLNGDGIVTKEEAEQAGKSLNKLWAMYDMDGDGRVDVEEIRRATADMAVGTALQKITGSAEGHVYMVDPAKVVASNDLDGDGIVTRDEAVKANKALLGLWDNYDLNKDGKLDAKEIARASGY